ncbi:MAG: hypothetical protein WAO20_01700 [Acidobacteriota bacterium]
MTESTAKFFRDFETQVQNVEGLVAALLPEMLGVPEAERCEKADTLFASIYERFMVAGQYPEPWRLAAYLAVGRQLALEVFENGWQDVHKGAHYYNMGLAELLSGHVDPASGYFLEADQEDQHFKAASPGDVFRVSAIYEQLRAFFLDVWFMGTEADYHDGETDWQQRRDRMIAALKGIPGRYIICRCQAGLWRACFVDGSVGWMEVPSELDRIRAVEDLAFFCEAVARKFNGSSTGTLGGLLQASTKCGQAGFVFDSNSGPAFEPDKPSASPSMETLKKARRGERTAIAHVVRASRNQAMHSSEFSDWYLNALREVIKVELDFISCVVTDPAYAP